MAELLLGIDGGGSKTLALVADRNGTVLGRGTAPSSNYQSVGFAAATAALEAAAAAALEDAGHSTGTIAAACLGLAGADRPDDRLRFERWFREHAAAERVAVVNDAELVLCAGTPAGWGVALISGTGSFCYGRAPDGRTARAGGWGYLIGDEGSGYAISIEALLLATQTADGRAAAHTILSAILDHWQLAEPQELVGYVYHPERTRAEIAALAPHIMALADDNDPHAQALVARAAYELGRMVAAVVRKLDLQAPPIATAGGVIGAYPALQHAVVTHAGVTLGPISHAAEPARGAIVLARRLITGDKDAMASRRSDG